jgi:hypothetical protein
VEWKSAPLKEAVEDILQEERRSQEIEQAIRKAGGEVLKAYEEGFEEGKRIGFEVCVLHNALLFLETAVALAKKAGEMAQKIGLRPEELNEFSGKKHSEFYTLMLRGRWNGTRRIESRKLFALLDDYLARRGLASGTAMCQAVRDCLREEAEP